MNKIKSAITLRSVTMERSAVYSETRVC